MLAGLLFCACVPIQPEPKDGLTDLASALAKLDEHPDPTEYLELLLELDVCVREELEGDATPILTEAESVAMTIYTLGALMAARTFERHEAIRTGHWTRRSPCRARGLFIRACSWPAKVARESNQGHRPARPASPQCAQASTT